jgi:hypothetical protein
MTTEALVTMDNTPAISEYFRSGNVAQLNDKEKDIVLAKLCGRYGLDPILRPFDLLNLGGKAVFYMNASALNQLAAQKDLSRRITELKIDEEKMVAKCVCEVSAPASGRTESATAWLSIGGYKRLDPKAPPTRVLFEGEDLCNALMKVEAKAKRRATMAFFGTPDYDPEARDTPAQVVIEQPTQQKTKEDIKAIATEVIVPVAQVAAIIETPPAPTKPRGRPKKEEVAPVVEVVVESPAAEILKTFGEPSLAADMVEIYTKGTPSHAEALKTMAHAKLSGWETNPGYKAQITAVAAAANGKIPVLQGGRVCQEFIDLCSEMMKR